METTIAGRRRSFPRVTTNHPIELLLRVTTKTLPSAAQPAAPIRQRKMTAAPNWTTIAGRRRSSRRRNSSATAANPKRTSINSGSGIPNSTWGRTKLSFFRRNWGRRVGGGNGNRRLAAGLDGGVGLALGVGNFRGAGCSSIFPLQFCNSITQVAMNDNGVMPPEVVEVDSCQF
ncbi:hypothetical protein LINPERHAP1_LOCUS31953 [Linum perenne]